MSRLISRRAAVLLACAAGALAIYAAYHWALQPIRVRRSRPPAPAMATVRLDDALFTSELEGRKTWSARVGSIEVTHALGAPPSSVQSAALTGIRDGTLYPLTADSRAGGRPVATFSAGSGSYTLGNSGSAPGDLRLEYNIRWQLDLTGGVTLTASGGDRLTAPELTILEMSDYRTGKLERRVLSQQTVEVERGRTVIDAAGARYDPAERMVECTAGVTGRFRDGAVKSGRLFWSLRDETIRCPDTASGVYASIPFTARNLTLDLKHRRYEADYFEGDIPRNSDLREALR